MPRIAVISDVHGNVPALEAALADLAGAGVDEILVGGDLVGRGPQGSEVVRRIRATGYRGVRGNHEDYLLGFRKEDVPKAWLHQEEWAASRWMAAELSDEDVAYIAALPFALTAESDPEVCLVHGSPRSNMEGLGPWSDDDELEHHVDHVEGEVLVCAHTHRPLVRRLRNGLVVNVGAVGLPFNRDRRAQYAILERTGHGWEVELRQIDYSVSAVLEIYENTGFLTQGGVTAQLLRLELENAAPFLVPFIKWAEVAEVPVASSEIDTFLDFYDLGESMGSFMQRLQKLR
ncbi:MAG: metallophosphoesterase family protein [bacterium]|nr:metallophosphoesterase family protein [bacterium]